MAAGRADVVDITLNGLPYRPLAIRYPTRVHSSIELFTMFLFLNTRQPPFTNIKARQAVNYAIDRARMIQLLGFDSPGQAAPTCQLLPAGSPSYQPYCPYTAGPQDGAWHGPDMKKARRLAQESGTTQVPVTVWNDQTDFGTSAGAYLAGLLKQLGYRATVRNVPQDQYHAALYNASHKVQLGLTGWAVNIPATSDFFLQILTCRSIYQDPAGTANLAGFCEPQVDRLASQAQAAQQTDPAGARKLWASSTAPSPIRHHWCRSSTRHSLCSSPPGSGTTRSPRPTAARCSTRSGSGSARNFTTRVCDHALVLADPPG